MKRPYKGIFGWAQRSCLAAALVGLCLPVGATLVYDNYTASGTLNQDVPDYNESNPQGWQNSINVSVASGLQVTDVRVSVDISGGYNGDLYGYLRHDDGANVGFIVLLDRPGYSGSGSGYGDAGFGPDGSSNPFVFSDAGAYAIENYQDHSPVYNSGQLTGTWKPDDGSVAFASAFSGLDPNGTWTLFLQDLATGDLSTVGIWGLQIEAVPEPITWALVIFGGLVGIFSLARSKWLRNRIEHWRVAVNEWLDAA